jgi:hypothetical protein
MAEGRQVLVALQHLLHRRHLPRRHADPLQQKIVIIAALRLGLGQVADPPAIVLRLR